MIIRFLFIFFLICLSNSIYSQEEYKELESEILNYEDNDLIIISKSRKLIIDKIKEKDLSKVKQILDYLKYKFDESETVALWEEESWLVYYWTENYDPLLEELKSYQRQPDFYYNDKIIPPRDLFWKNLFEETITYFDSLLFNIKNSNLEMHKREFLVLFLKFLRMDYDSEYITQEEINIMADDYLSTYSYSPFNTFIRSHIRFVLKESPNALGFEFFSGYGKFQGNLENYFTSNVPLGLAGELRSNKFIVFLRLYLGVGSNVKKEFIYNGNWKKDLLLNVIIPEVTVGYSLIGISRIRMSPFAGIAFMNIAPPTEEAEKEGNDVDLGFVFASVFGFNFDILFGKIPQNNFAGYKNGAGFIRLRFGIINPDYERKVNEFSGKMIYVSVGIGGIIRSLYREF
jgi:hypothetical protein